MTSLTTSSRKLLTFEKLPKMTASGGISREKFKQGSRYFTSLSRTCATYDVPLGVSGRLQNAFNYCRDCKVEWCGVLPSLTNWWASCSASSNQQCLVHKAVGLDFPLDFPVGPTTNIIVEEFCSSILLLELCCCEHYFFLKGAKIEIEAVAVLGTITDQA